jgi:hypothetical protein
VPVTYEELWGRKETGRDELMRELDHLGLTPKEMARRLRELWDITEQRAAQYMGEWSYSKDMVPLKHRLDLIEQLAKLRGLFAPVEVSGPGGGPLQVQALPPEEQQILTGVAGDVVRALLSRHLAGLQAPGTAPAPAPVTQAVSSPPVTQAQSSPESSPAPARPTPRPPAGTQAKGKPRHILRKKGVQ